MAKLKYPTLCAECGVRMEAGEAFILGTAKNGQVWRAHVSCPDPAGPNVRRDPSGHARSFEDRFLTLTCSQCGHRMSFKRDGKIPLRCPTTIYSRGEPCGGGWVDDDDRPWP